jgi:integrase
MKYLQQRKGTWYIRMRKPPKSWGLPGEFIHTLRTPNLNTARQIRDKYLIPILAETKGIEMAESILRLISNSDELIKQKLQNLGEILGDENNEFTVFDIFERFIEYKRKIGSKQSTLNSYAACMASLKRLLPYEAPINEITTRHITDWRDKLLDLPPGWMKMKIISSSERKMSKTTVNNQLVRFRAVWDWAQKENYILRKLQNPAKGISAGKSSKVKTNKMITVDECNRLMDMPFPKHSTTFNEKAWKYIPLIARYTGARLAEISQLTTKDLKLIQGILSIEITNYDDKTTKNEQSVRTVPISDKLLKLINPIILECENSPNKHELFPNRGDYEERIAKSFSHRWNLHAKRIAPHCYFHGLRAYTITQMANAGISQMDRMKIVGHTSNSSHAGYTKDDLKRYKSALDTVF